MKILGAEGLLYSDGNNVKALDYISSNYLTVGDCCCAKYNDKFYWYVLEGVTLDEDLPNIVKPLPKTGIDSNKRWILKNIFLTEVEAQTVYTNNIRPLSGTNYVNLNDTAQLSGNEFIFNNTTTPPFVVNSQVQVNNLNAEYWGGQHWSTFDISGLIDTGDRWIDEGVDTVTITYPEPRSNITYSLFTELFNTEVAEPSLISHMVTSKTETGFTVVFSSETDNQFYRLQWAVLGENIDAEAYNLQDSNGNYMLDVGFNQIQVF